MGTDTALKGVHRVALLPPRDSLSAIANPGALAAVLTSVTVDLVGVYACLSVVV